MPGNMEAINSNTKK